VQLVALQVDHVAVQGIGDDRVLGDLAGEDRVPDFHQVRAELLLCAGNDGRRGDRPGVGEGGEERGQAEEVIAVAVRDADRGEVLPGRPDPLRHPPRVLGGKDGVDQHRVALAADQRD
jgi:hypothetical protein